MRTTTEVDAIASVITAAEAYAAAADAYAAELAAIHSGPTVGECPDCPDWEEQGHPDSVRLEASASILGDALRDLARAYPTQAAYWKLLADRYGTAPASWEPAETGCYWRDAAQIFGVRAVRARDLADELREEAS